jgi:hypothetical protein
MIGSPVDEDIRFLKNSEESFEIYLKNYIAAVGKPLKKEMKHDIAGLKRIISAIKSFRGRMEELDKI